MPRIARGVAEGGIFHVLNRGNHRQMLFRRPQEFALFLDLLSQSVARFEVELWGYCLMGNHWHLVVSAPTVEELSRWMHWLSNRHVRMVHGRNAKLGGGHVYQGRYKSFPVQDEGQLWTVLRYVEANPLRARLVKRAEDWAWSSLSSKPVFDGQIEVTRPKLNPWPRDARWRKAVNAPLEAALLDLLRRSVVRGTPYGLPDWVATFAGKTGMESTLRPRGRPRKPIPEV
jgi:putative transposase